MRKLLLLIGFVMAASVAFAGEDNAADVPLAVQDACNLPYVYYDWDFNVGDQGFTTITCDGTSGAPVWAWGLESTIPGSPSNV